MYCTYILTISCMKMFLRNKQALFFSLFMPMMILFIFGSLDFDKPSKMSIGLVTHSPTTPTAMFVSQIRSFKAFAIDEGTLDSQLKELRAGNRVAVLDVPDNLISIPAPADPPQLTVY